MLLELGYVPLVLGGHIAWISNARRRRRRFICESASSRNPVTPQATGTHPVLGSAPFRVSLHIEMSHLCPLFSISTWTS